MTIAALMVSEDQNAIRHFREESRNGADSLVKKFASDTLPELQALLVQAQEIEDASR